MSKNTHNNSMTEEQLDRVLSLFEAGVHPDDIIKKFPHHRDEIIDTLRVVEVMARDAHHEMPSEDLLARAIKRVTQTDSARYTRRGVSSIIGSLIDAFDAISAHARIAVPVVAVALLLVIFVTHRPSDPAKAPELTQLSQIAGDTATSENQSGDSAGATMKSANEPALMAARSIPPATGNADDVLAAFSESFSEEESLMALGDGDIAGFIADDGANAYQNFYAEEL